MTTYVAPSTSPERFSISDYLPDPLISPDRLRCAYRWRPGDPGLHDLPTAPPWTSLTRPPRTTGYELTTTTTRKCVICKTEPVQAERFACDRDVLKARRWLREIEMYAVYLPAHTQPAKEARDAGHRASQPLPPWI